MPSLTERTGRPTYTVTLTAEDAAELAHVCAVEASFTIAAIGDEPIGSPLRDELAHRGSMLLAVACQLQTQLKGQRPLAAELLDLARPELRLVR